MVPDGWTAVQMGDLVDIAQKTISASTLASNDIVRLYSLAAFDQGQEPESVPGSSIGSSKVEVPVQAVLLSKLNPHIPRIWQIQHDGAVLAVASTEFWPLVPKRTAPSVDPGFLRHCLSSPGFLNHPLIQPASSTNSHRRIRRSAFERYSQLLPPLQEQQKIAAILSSVDDAIAATRDVIEQTKRVRHGLLQTLMTAGIGHTRLKKTEIGEIPAQWGLIALGDACAHITKGATPTTYGYDWVEAGDGGILFLRSECISDEGFQLVGSKHIPMRAHAAMSRSEIRSGDVLVTITGNVGRVAQVPPGIGAANINQHIARIRIQRPDLLQDFVHFALKTNQQRARFETIVTGLAYPQLSLQQIRETVVPLPSIPEQKAIVERISAVLEVQRENEKSVARLHRIKRGLMQDLLTGRVRVHST
jgi:type I restriction enzyme S subunit